MIEQRRRCGVVVRVCLKESLDNDDCFIDGLLTHGGTERTRTVIDLVDDQVPHLSATVPKLAARAGFEPAIS